MLVILGCLPLRDIANGWNPGVLWLYNAWSEQPCTSDSRTGPEFSYKYIKIRSLPGAAGKQSPHLAAWCDLTELTRWVIDKPVFPAWELAGNWWGSVQRHNVEQLLGASGTPQRVEHLCLQKFELIACQKDIFFLHKKYLPIRRNNEKWLHNVHLGPEAQPAPTAVSPQH